MSTRSTIHFARGDEDAAIVYRHYDGHPDSILPDLERFFDAVEAQTVDTRFNDPSYLAAKYVVWQAGEYARKGPGTLDFLGVGVVLSVPGDVEFSYRVDCALLGRPLVTLMPT